MVSVYELLKKRRSCRKYQDKLIEKRDIDTLLNAALMSPSSKRANPWEFIAVTNKDILSQLSNCKEHASSFVAEAPLAIVVIANTEKSDVWVEDASIASILLQLTAEDLGLGSCWVQIRNRNSKQEKVNSDKYVRNVLNIPEEYAVESIISIGYKIEERKPFDEEKLQKEKLHFDKF